MLNFCDFIQVFVFTTNHHLNRALIIYTYVIKVIQCDPYIRNDRELNSNGKAITAVKHNGCTNTTSFMRDEGKESLYVC